MILVLDCGNSRLAWGLAGPHGWVVQDTGAVLPRRLLAWPVVHPPLALAA